VGPEDLVPVQHQLEADRRVKIPAEGRRAGNRLAIAIGVDRQRAVCRTIGRPRVWSARYQPIKLADHRSCGLRHAWALQIWRVPKRYVSGNRAEIAQSPSRTV